MHIALWIGLGSALGGMGRYWLSGLIATRVGETFPWGTLVVNVSGSLLIGFLATLTSPEGRFWLTPKTRLFFMSGICGGYTTFSSFSLQTLDLAREGDWFKASANIVLSTALCLLAAWVGHLVALSLNSIKGA
jgi:CrcB protein